MFCEFLLACKIYAIHAYVDGWEDNKLSKQNYVLLNIQISRHVNTSVFSLNDIWRTVQYVLLAAIWHNTSQRHSAILEQVYRQVNKVNGISNEIKFWIIPHLNHINGASQQDHVFCLTTIQTRQKMLQPFYIRKLIFPLLSQRMEHCAHTAPFKSSNF